MGIGLGRGEVADGLHGEPVGDLPGYGRAGPLGGESAGAIARESVVGTLGGSGLIDRGADEKGEPEGNERAPQETEERSGTEESQGDQAKATGTRKQRGEGERRLEAVMDL